MHNAERSSVTVLVALTFPLVAIPALYFGCDLALHQRAEDRRSLIGSLSVMIFATGQLSDVERRLDDQADEITHVKVLSAASPP